MHGENLKLISGNHSAFMYTTNGKWQKTLHRT